MPIKKPITVADIIDKATQRLWEMVNAKDATPGSLNSIIMGAIAIDKNNRDQRDHVDDEASQMTDEELEAQIAQTKKELGDS
jgi:hypothetical protein